MVCKPCSEWGRKGYIMIVSIPFNRVMVCKQWEENQKLKLRRLKRSQSPSIGSWFVNKANLVALVRGLVVVSQSPSIGSWFVNSIIRCSSKNGRINVSIPFNRVMVCKLGLGWVERPCSTYRLNPLQSGHGL